MRKWISFMLVLMLVCSLAVGISAAPSSEFITTTATGYDSADDVLYITYSQSGKTVIANWGARGEDCVFLSTYAEDYYTGDYIWDVMSDLSGGTTTSNTPSSDLYLQLQELMESTHSFYTYYNGSKNVRDYYRYTDCVSSDITQVALLYRGGLVTSEWNSGKIWNQEHTWPRSKLHSDEQIGDIMMLRPTNPSENSSRGNKAYGEGSDCYDPGVSVRGDCARTVLYMYVRYGVTDTMWGSDGVIESLDILLQWMEEDPVDTWEMGRNDAVQSVTGVRNVFVDYPEYAWLLFDREVPEDMVTPSGEAMNGEDTPKCPHSSTTVKNAKDATCGEDGYSGDTYCRDCGELLSSGSKIPATGNHLLDTTGHCTGCDYYEEPPACAHPDSEIKNQKAATCGSEGYTGDTCCAQCGVLLSAGEAIPATGEHENIEHRNQSDATCVTDGHTGDVYCADCGQFVASGSVIPATGEHHYGDNNLCTVCGKEYQCPHSNVVHRGQKDATCGADGYTGDIYCADCLEFIEEGESIPATGAHTPGEWTTTADGSQMERCCSVCGGQKENKPLEESDAGLPWIWIGVGAGAIVIVAVAIVILRKKKK